MPYPDPKRGLRKAVSDSRKRNKRKKEMIKDSKTPKPYKTALKFEDIVATFPEVKRRKKRK